MGQVDAEKAKDTNPPEEGDTDAVPPDEGLSSEAPGAGVDEEETDGE